MYLKLGQSSLVISSRSFVELAFGPKGTRNFSSVWFSNMAFSNIAARLNTAATDAMEFAVSISSTQPPFVVMSAVEMIILTP